MLLLSARMRHLQWMSCHKCLCHSHVSLHSVTSSVVLDINVAAAIANNAHYKAGRLCDVHMLNDRYELNR